MPHYGKRQLCASLQWEESSAFVIQEIKWILFFLPSLDIEATEMSKIRFKVQVCSNTASSTEISGCSHSEEQRLHLCMITLTTSASDVLTSPCLDFLACKMVANDTDASQLTIWLSLAFENTLEIVQRKSLFLDHRHHQRPNISQDTTDKVPSFQWELLMLDKI